MYALEKSVLQTFFQLTVIKILGPQARLYKTTGLARLIVILYNFVLYLAFVHQLYLLQGVYRVTYLFLKAQKQGRASSRQ